ncbi:hypothetical protein [Desulfoplanes sp.]
MDGFSGLMFLVANDGEWIMGISERMVRSWWTGWPVVTGTS